MYLRTVQLGIQDLAGHPWLLHACAMCAAISFFAYGLRCIQLLHRCSVACVCKKTPEHQQVSVEDPGCVR